MSLYLVGTPIGNLEDITLRAVRVLKECPVILVEKWSDSIKLFKHYEIKADKVLSYDDKNHRRVTPKVLEMLEQDMDIALITSAGMPGVSDPGNFLVDACRQKGIKVFPIPGSSALTAAISIAGFTGSFLFVGFLPKKIGQIKKVFSEAFDNKHNLVFFESTYRLSKTLELLQQLYPEVRIMIGKEMTKMFEQYIVVTPTEALDKISEDKKFSRGEFTLIVNFS